MNCVVSVDIDIDCNWKNIVGSIVVCIDNLTNSRSLPLVFILALCIRIHVYTIHNLAAIGRLQYFLKQHMSILLYFKKLGREVGLIVLQPGLDELLLGKEL